AANHVLNYFLLNLVGPKKKGFKVQDKSTLEFDPAIMVKEFIYVNLVGSNDFCLAVSQEGRSYISDLFKYAEEVLAKIGGEFAAKVVQIRKQHKEDQAALIYPPDDFIVLIMSTLMIDPVILPRSKATVDRCTIARHL
uniref:Ubiquitin conjugation factor E4 A n=1 Tax=Megaselia scalaris TaxID=36166 RepID=T1GHI6_MEGSC